MKLLTKALRAKLPKLRETESQELGDKTVWVKFFTPDSNWTWFALEFDGTDEFFGLVDGFCAEFGSFSLRELETARGPLGLPIERDRHWTPKPLREVNACPSWAKE